MAPKPSIRATGGTPNGMPDFRPINPWGRDPVWPANKRLGPVPVDRKLCQIIVKWDGKRVPIGPKAPRDFCERLLVSINSLIGSGREVTWTNPEIIEVNRVLS